MHDSEKMWKYAQVMHKLLKINNHTVYNKSKHYCVLHTCVPLLKVSTISITLGSKANLPVKGTISTKTSGIQISLPWYFTQKTMWTVMVNHSKIKRLKEKKARVLFTNVQFYLLTYIHIYNKWGLCWHFKQCIQYIFTLLLKANLVTFGSE